MPEKLRPEPEEGAVAALALSPDPVARPFPLAKLFEALLAWWE
jgi:hypothetical protein